LLSPFTKCNAQTNQTVTNGGKTTAIDFTGATCTYKWANSNPYIGLPASGTGNIPSFTAVNTGGNPVVATITATPIGSGFAYIVNAGSGDVSVINTATNKVVADIPVGSNPNSVCVDPNYDEVYVVNNSSNTISVISTLTNKVTATIPVGPSPWSVTVSPNGSLAYVADGGNNDVEVINTASNKIVKTISAGTNPNAIAVSPDGNLLYVNNSNQVTVINTTTNKVITNIPVGSAPQAILITPDGNTVYEANYASNDVYAINTKTNTVSAIIPVGSNPGGGSMSPDGSVVYVANESSNSVSVISTATNMVTNTIPVGVNPWGVSVRPDGSQVYVANAGSSTISIVDPTTNAIISTIPVGSSPYSFGSFFTGGAGCSQVLNYTITVNPGSTPAITASSAAGAISGCAGTASVNPNIQQFTVSGNGLKGNISLTAPTGFEVSLSAGSNYSTDISIAPTSGTVGNTVIYVRSSATAAAGKISGNVMLTSSGATSLQVAVNGMVNALPTVNPIQNQIVTNGSRTIAVNFTGTGNTYTWINNTPGIGLAASGTGNIPSFTAINTGNVAVTANITVTSVNKQADFEYMTDGTSSQVSVISNSTNSIISTIDVGAEPYGIAVSPDGSTAYVSNYIGASVSVINLSENKVISTIPIGNGPIGIAISPDGRRIYVCFSLGVEVIDASTNQVIKVIGLGNYEPAGLTVSPDGKWLYVADPNNAVLVIINTSTYKDTIVYFPTNILDPAFNVATSPDGSLIYVTGANTHGIWVVDASSQKLIKTINLTLAPIGIAVSPDGSRIYVTDEYSNAVSVVNATDGTLITDVAVGTSPEGISVSPDGGTVYVANVGSNTMSVINTSTNQVTATIAAGANPHSLGNFVKSTIGCNGPPVTFTITVNPTIPTITTSAATGIISACLGSASVDPNIEQFTVSGNNLTGDITAEAPKNFDISLSPGYGYGGSLTFPQTNGKVPATTVYVRSGASDLAGDISGDVALTSAGAQNKYVPVNGTVNALPTVDALNNLAVTNGTVVAVGFTGSANTFAWVNDTPGIGLAASGMGNISSFAAVNTGASPVTATITVMPQSATGCTGSSTTFTITVSPTIAPTITIAGILSPLSTVYGTPSTTTSFTTSGTNLTSGILVMPPAGFEVSADDKTFNNTVTVMAGNSAASTIYIRLAATTHVGNYQGNIVLNSDGASDIDEPMPLSTVSPALLTISADNKSKAYNTPNPALTITYSGFQNGDGPAQLTAQPLVTTTAITSSPGGSYPIMASGAVAKDYTFKYVPGLLTISAVLSAATIPNTFTPNNDGINDTWDIKNLDTYLSCTVNIFNRYGQNLFSSIGYGTPWDGKYHGSNVPTGTYYYIIDLNDDQHAVLSGWVAIIR
jgi:gliding motility-associated-like protein